MIKALTTVEAQKLDEAQFPQEAANVEKAPIPGFLKYGGFMHGIYLFSCVAIHKQHDIVYQDINGKRDIGGDALDVNLDEYDFIIATPPCNYYSKANSFRETSEYSQNTKHLLPSILDKLIKNYFNKPFIVENVLNESLIPHDYDYDLFVYKVGGHTYWTNIKLPSIKELPFEKTKKATDNTLGRQGGYNVHLVVEYFLRVIQYTQFEFWKDPLDDFIKISN